MKAIIAALLVAALVGVEYIALAIASTSLALSLAAFLLARQVRRAYQHEVAKQSTVAESLVEKATEIDAKIRNVEP